MESPIWRGRDDELRPFGNIKASDSANLDMVAEVLIFTFMAQISVLLLNTMKTSKI